MASIFRDSRLLLLTTFMSTPPSLSDRALQRLGLPAPHVYNPPPGPYYHPELYPDATINLTTAENSLLTDRLIEHLSRPINILPHHLKYRTTLLKSTLPTVEDLLPQYINDHFDPLVPVTRESSVTGPGIGAIFAQLIWALVGEGEGVLISNPFYDEYVRDIVHPGLSVLVRTDIPPDVDSLSMDVFPFLEEKLLASDAEGVKIKVLLLCNPHNPLPQVIPSDVVKGYALFAQRHNLHLVVDEVYALSTFKSALYPPATDEPFKSMLSYDLRALDVDPARVHVLAGPTKDFGASGMKLGLVVSPANPTLLKVLRPLFNATPISSASDVLFAHILADKPFVEQFLTDNRRALAAAYDFVASWMTFHRLEFTRANAGVYVLVDLAPFLARLVPLSATPQEALDRGVASMLKEKVFLKPTSLMADPIPTRFRLIFTQTKSTMKLALRRIEAAFGAPEAPFVG
ncbi:PLP-dependent transferase [Mycena sp. CBHHK59/15]|nr:PLP-dependent transferase [Mycena sp. CBHHK59/15]